VGERCLSARICVNNYTYLECGSIKGEPIVGAGVWRLPGEDPAAISGCKKFRRVSSRSWCCVRHFARISGNVSNCSCREEIFHLTKMHSKFNCAHKNVVAWFIFINAAINKPNHWKSRKWSNKLQLKSKKCSYKSVLGLKYMQFFTLFEFNFFASIFATCCARFSSGTIQYRRVSLLAYIHKIYLHSIAQYFILLCIQKCFFYEPCSFIHKHRKISIRCYLNFTAEKKLYFATLW
jgi:hypothetical protein